MLNRIRRSAAALATVVLALSLAVPARADRVQSTSAEPSFAPMIFDAAFLRPVGLLMTGVGVAFYVFPVAPFMLVTRPTDVFKPLKPMVGYPVQFTFLDPIGVHPGTTEGLCRGTRGGDC